jgi:hypothetical protein
MGLLDDAIREHLELKRQHGGDPGEIERQEHEALGRADRREDDEPAASGASLGGAEGAEGEAEAPSGPVTEEHPEDFAADAPTTVYSPADVDGTTRGDEIDPPAGEEELPSAGHDADAPGYDEDPWLEETDERPAAPPAQQDDVLEETPDFLQETPEHDRLWFEQKPPRGFDWDR